MKKSCCCKSWFRCPNLPILGTQGTDSEDFRISLAASERAAWAADQSKKMHSFHHFPTMPPAIPSEWQRLLRRCGVPPGCHIRSSYFPTKCSQIQAQHLLGKGFPKPWILGPKKVVGPGVSSQRSDQFGKTAAVQTPNPSITSRGFRAANFNDSNPIGCFNQCPWNPAGL